MEKIIKFGAKEEEKKTEPKKSEDKKVKEIKIRDDHECNVTEHSKPFCEICGKLFGGF